jgi:Kef-type K+ transport system membrane component KefB
MSRILAMFRPAPASSLRVWLLYSAMLAATVIGFEGIRAAGARLTAPAATGPDLFGTASVGHKLDTLLQVLLALVVVIIAARIVGAVFRYLHQPPVIGEVVAGIVLGPSLLGHIAPQVSSYLLPDAVAPYLGMLANVGVIFYMFLVGLELDGRVLRRETNTTVIVSHTSIVVPFLLGAALALAIYPILSTSDVPFTVFALFMGVSMSVTAFPVLARILTDLGITRTRIGVMALTCAAIDDVTAWCLLAFLVSVVHSQVGSIAITLSLTVGYVVMVTLIGRPLVTRWSNRVDRRRELTQSTIAVIIVGLLVSALTTEYIGIHAIFGAFLLGVIIPHDSLIARELARRLQDIVVVLLLPAFFAFTGLRTQIGLVSGWHDWALCAGIILVACLGKFGGSAVAARFTGIPWREAAALGILMNTRGLMELVVLNIGLDLKVIGPRLFAMLVIMAVTTTLMTTPILHGLTRRTRTAEDARRAEADAITG